MIRVAVVEDEVIYQEQLRAFLQQYQVENGEVFNLSFFADGDEIVNDYRPQFDIIFLDIQMKFMDGMTAAEHIRLVDRDVILIFITNMASYAIQGYAVNAFDFILKPVSYFAFSAKLSRAVDIVNQRKKKTYVTLKIDGGVVRLYLNQIYYIESMKHRITVHTDTKAYSLISTMKEMEEKLGSEHFFRCNNCYLVNLAWVEQVNDGEVFVGGQKLQVSRPRRKAFMAALTDYLGGVAR